MKIAMLVYPGMTPLDMVGPLQTWSMLPEVEIQLVWKNTDPVTTDTGMAIVPTHAYADAFEQPDILFCGGGVKPTIDLMQDAETIQFLKDRGQRAQWVTSVCTGALLLGAAGLLGIVPESGPHLIFVTLHGKGVIPLSTLVASSIVQDGHGMLPLLAYSRLEFLEVKAINLGVGLLVGALMMSAGW